MATQYAEDKYEAEMDDIILEKRIKEIKLEEAK